MLAVLGLLLFCLPFLGPFAIPPLLLRWGRQLEVSFWLFVAASVVLRVAA